MITELRAALVKRDIETASRLSLELQRHIQKDLGVTTQTVVEADMETPRGVTPYEFVDLTPFIRRESVRERYFAGGQIELLRDALDVDWILLETEGDYQGDWYGIFQRDGRWHIVNGYFGSCSSCDDLEDSDPFQWLENNVKNVRAFNSKEALMEWLRDTDEFSYRGIKDKMLEILGEK